MSAKAVGFLYPLKHSFTYGLQLHVHFLPSVIEGAQFLGNRLILFIDLNRFRFVVIKRRI